MKKGILCFLGILLFSCNEKVVEAPENLIPKEKMVLVLYDLALLNSIKSTSNTVLEKNNIEVMDYLFEKHDLDSLQFVQSDLYYASIPLEYQSIYEKVEALLEKESAEWDELIKKRTDSIREAQKNKKDSIQKPIKATPPDA